MHSQFEATLTKYCVSCHATEKVNLLIDINNMWFDMENDDDEYTANVIRTDPKYEGKLRTTCAFCGSKRTCLLDDKIGDVVAALNQKGYKTWFSCDGYDDEEYTLPYISFDYTTTPLDIFYDLPDGWGLLLDADLETAIDNIIQSSHLASLYYDCGDINWNKDQMLEWVNGLPHNDLNQDAGCIVKHPGERYQLEDIKAAFEYKGYSVSSMRSFQLDEKWVVIIKFNDKVPSILPCIRTMISKCEIAIALDTLSTDCIHSTVNKILKARY